MAEWLTGDEARTRWRDAPADDVYLAELLEVAKAQVLAFGPKSTADAIAADPTTVPDAYRLAQLAQMRNVWNAVKTDPSSQGIGDEGFVIRPFPMDWTVKNLIRPVRAVPVVL